MSPAATAVMPDCCHESHFRNMAYSEDAETCKKAYEAELACYADIELPVSYALCGIKKQANILAERRGYESVLDMNLDKSNMKAQSLQALLTAIEKYLPIFWRYLKAKAKLLGHEGALPWYDLFAPVGSMDAEFTAEEAGKYLVETFTGFSDAMVEMISKAFHENWIDFYPRDGKVGGAFCSDVPWLKQSRILTNFNGSFDAVVTLAHELEQLGMVSKRARSPFPNEAEYDLTEKGHALLCVLEAMWNWTLRYG